MTRKNMPIILMLVAGAVTCVITFIFKYSILGKLLALLIVLVVFFLLGNVMKCALDYFENENNEKSGQGGKEGEVIEKQEQDEEVKQP